MKSKNKFLKFFILSLAGGIALVFFTKNISIGFLLSFGWSGGCMMEHSGFPFFIKSCPPLIPDPVLGPMLCGCSMNLIAMILNAAIYSAVIFLTSIFLT